MSINAFDFTQASLIYGVANTPAFLIRKLQADVAIRALAEAETGEEFVSALKRAVSVEPVTSNEAVRPYVLLVALWFKPEIQHLREAANISAPSWRWFTEIAYLLLQTFSPVQHQTLALAAPTLLQHPSNSVVSSTTTTRLPTIVLTDR